MIIAQRQVAPGNANYVVSSSAEPLCPWPPAMSPNCFDKGPCFSLMLGFSRLVIDAGLSEAAALIVFKTTYLSYECFIQETKYELAGWEPPQEYRGMVDSCMLITAGEKEGKEKTCTNLYNINSMASVFYHRLFLLYSLCQSLSVLVTSNKSSAISFQKQRNHTNTFD